VLADQLIGAVGGGCRLRSAEEAEAHL